MALDHRVLLIIGLLTGSYTSSQISRVSVKVGRSITIPRVYVAEYTGHVKYLCQGYYWNSCKHAVKTNAPDKSRRFSIFDDKYQRVFSVTIRNVTTSDTDYWCVVEKTGADDGEYFRLSVTGGTPDLYVDHQEVRGFTGDNVTISCHHSASSDQMWWCKLGGGCVKGSGGRINGWIDVSLKSSVPGVFNVTLNNVRTESSGWYLCSNGDLQMPVHVSVTDRPITTTALTPTTTTESTTGSWRFLRSPLDFGLFISLCVLVFVVIIAAIIWFTLRKQSSSKPQTSAKAQCEDTTYCNVGARFTNEKSEQRPSDGSVDVTYSSVVIAKPRNPKVVEPTDDNVTYSTLKDYQTSS